VLFRVLHLLIDTRDGVIAEYVDPLTFLNYTLNFTAIISGPIQRYEEYAATQLLAQRPRLDVIDAGVAIERIVIGYFKISVLGFVLQTLQTRALAGLDLMSGQTLSDRTLAAAAIGALYPLYLFCNFSGYTDIVIGVARGFRLVLPENFDRPFEATNFLDFWSRWHMSLSNWLKTYVYGPLVKTLMQRFPHPKLIPYWGVFAFFFTFFLIGAWHGRTSVFMVYGILLGLGVSMNKLYQIVMAQRLGKKGYKALGARAWYRTVSRGLTFTYFSFSLVWFWSNWGQMALILRTLGGQAVLLGWLAIFALATVLLAAYELLRAGVLSIRNKDGPLAASRYVRVMWATTLVVIMVTFLNLLSVPAPEVIYKAF
jgi:D-alanyl-lipoteichoic acid acyltransferase DltB (MBOAT superfamily)